MFCPHCQRPARREVDPASGTSACSECGAVFDDNNIVSEIQFGETAGGAAIVQGSYVAAGQSGARTVGPNGRRTNGLESAEQSKQNGRREIVRLGNALNLADRVIDTATRWYTLAIANGFVKGRRIVYVAAACAYVACRMEKTTHMLIDFSDQLQINVFVLGSTYLSLVKTCGQSHAIPAIDPSLYITRFTQLLDFGDETQKVAQDAVRLVQRFDRDWMNTGRRPAGICGACCLLAARMNNFRRSVAEIVQVVKIADTTIKRRLEEFKETPSGKLSIQDFRNVWLAESVDPPAYMDDKKKKATKAKKNKKRKRGQSEEVELDEEGEALDQDDEDAIDKFAKQASNADSMLDGTSLTELGINPTDYDNEPLIDSTNYDDAPLNDDDPVLLDEEEATPAAQAKAKGKGRKKKIPTPPPVDPEEQRIEKEIVDPAIEAEIQDQVDSRIGEAIMDECDEQEQRRLEYAEDNRLDNLDEDELDQFLLTPEEAKVKERLWMEMNKEYLEHIAAKQRAAENEDGTRKKPRIRKRNKPRDSTNASGATATESATEFLKKKKVSKKLNYAAIDGLFTLDKDDNAKKDGTEYSSRTGRSGYDMERDQTPSDIGSTMEMREQRTSVSPVPEDEEPEEDENDDNDETMQEVPAEPLAESEDEEQQLPRGKGQLTAAEEEYERLVRSQAPEDQFDLDEDDFGDD